MITLCTSNNCESTQTAPTILMVERGTTIYSEGDTANFWYEVSAGTVRTCRYLANGQRHLTGFYYPEDAFGLDLEVYRETAESVSDVVLSRHPTRADRDIAHARDGMLEKAWEQARERIFLFGHKTAANRVAAFILEVGERTHASGLELPMSRSDIADYLNLTLHTVSRTISDFARKDLISLNGPQNIRIVDIDGLRAVAGDQHEAPNYSYASSHTDFPWPTV
ncbi:MAG TPA: helix-turn-helix domain-containing protein [Sphingomicrobium sp.]|nr:helix-turn-helix domain-containing protein [Sphingomicrobium sp.]